MIAERAAMRIKKQLRNKNANLHHLYDFYNILMRNQHEYKYVSNENVIWKFSGPVRKLLEIFKFLRDMQKPK